MDDNDDVPPLEDMSELLQQVSAIKESRTSIKNTSAEQHKDHSNGTGVVTSKNTVKKDDNLQPLNKKENAYETKSESQVEKNTGRSDKAFGGMKKGFLFGNPNKSKKSAVNSVTSQTGPAKSDTKNTSAEEIPLVKPKVSKEEQYRIPEVQNAMSAGQALLNNKEWITEDLLSNVSKNETLIKKLGDPRFMHAMQEFQTNPAEAMQKYKDNMEVQQFLHEFCGIMGEHFNSLADKQDSADVPRQTMSQKNSVHTTPADSGADLQVRSSTNPKQATAADEAKMQEILSDPEIKNVLLDPRIQKIIETLRTDPDKVQKALHMADADLRQKINKLVDSGLLQFQT